MEAFPGAEMEQLAAPRQILVSNVAGARIEEVFRKFCLATWSLHPDEAMHPEVVRDEPGDCPKCGMALEPRTVTIDEHEDSPELRDMTRRFVIACVFAVPLVVVAMGDQPIAPRRRIIREQDLENRLAPAPDDAEQAGASLAAADPAAGLEVYRRTCASCHDDGVAGAPRLADKDAWRQRLDQRGAAGLMANALNGFRGEAGYMPPRGGSGSLGDQEVAAAVAYMLDQHDIKVEPE